MRPYLRVRYLRVFALGAVAASAALLVAGCGSHHAGQSGAAGSPSTSSSPTTSRPSKPPGRVAVPGPRQNGPTVAVVGTLTRGAQPSCVILRTAAGQSFQLVGPGAKTVPASFRRQHMDGSLPVTVKGHIGHSVVSYCQVGRPFVSDTVTVRH
jgi:hypothetical protein